jgi:hypothetical protein
MTILVIVVISFLPTTGYIKTLENNKISTRNITFYDKACRTPAYGYINGMAFVLQN